MFLLYIAKIPTPTYRKKPEFHHVSFIHHKIPVPNLPKKRDLQRVAVLYKRVSCFRQVTTSLYIRIKFIERNRIIMDRFMNNLLDLTVSMHGSQTDAIKTCIAVLQAENARLNNEILGLQREIDQVRLNAINIGTQR